MTRIVGIGWAEMVKTRAERERLLVSCVLMRTRARRVVSFGTVQRRESRPLWGVTRLIGCQTAPLSDEYSTLSITEIPCESQPILNVESTIRFSPPFGERMRRMVPCA